MTDHHVLVAHGSTTSRTPYHYPDPDDPDRPKCEDQLRIVADEHGIGLGDYLAGRRELPGAPAAGAHPTSLKAFGMEVRDD